MTSPLSALGPAGVFTNLDRLDATESLDYVRQAEQLGYDAFWINETFGREPFALLGALARATHRITLGLSVAVIYARGPFTARAGAQTLLELSGGRFVMGMGVSNPVTVESVRGRRFEPPTAALRAYADAYHAATYKGPGAAAEPALLFAALGDAMVRLAARHSEGAFAYLVTAERVRAIRNQLDHINPSSSFLAVAVPVRVDNNADRARASARTYLAPYLVTPTYRQSFRWQGFTDRDLELPLSDAMVDRLVLCGSASDVRRRLLELTNAGADHVAILPLGPDGGRADHEALRALAPPW